MVDLERDSEPITQWNPLSTENLRRSVDYCLEHLRGTKKIDLFQTGRVDPNIPIEDAMRSLIALQKEGKFDYIGISECSEATLRRANAIAETAMIEIEISPIAYEEETKKGTLHSVNKYECINYSSRV